MGLLDLDFGFDTGIGSALSSVIDGISSFGSNLLNGGGQDTKSGGLLNSLIKNPTPLLQTGLLTASVLSGGGEDYGTSKEYLDAGLALEREKLAQALEIAKLQAAGGGAGASAAIEVAKIGARNNALLAREKALADNLALKLDTIKGQPELTQNAIGMLGNALQQRGAASQSGYNQMANVLAGGRR